MNFLRRAMMLLVGAAGALFVAPVTWAQLPPVPPVSTFDFGEHSMVGVDPPIASAKAELGKYLSVTPGNPRSLAILRSPTPQEGAISFWLYPRWGEHRHESNVILTAGWDRDRSSYMAISQGWWEPLASSRFVAVISNRDYLSCSYDKELRSDVWQFIVVSWRAGPAGFCRIYINGSRVVDQPIDRTASVARLAKLIVGSDKAATDRRGRGGRFLLDELSFYEQPLQDREVLQWHEKYEGGRFQAENRRWAWLLESSREKSRGETVNRVLFDESWQWARSRIDIDRLVSQARRAGFNVIVPCVWHGGGTYFPSRVAETAPSLKVVQGSGFDPLQYLLQAARKSAVEVHPMLTLAFKEGGWGDRFSGVGVPKGALNLHDSALQQFYVDLVDDLTRRYEIQGLNLDYVRTMGICTTSDCQQDYVKKMGASLAQDLEKSDVAGPERRRIQQWQDDVLGGFVSRLSRAARQNRPGLVISVDSHPVPSGTMRPLDGRNDISWVRNGDVDVIFNMEYGVDVDLQNQLKVQEEISGYGHSVLLVANYDRIDGVAISRSGRIVDGVVRSIQRAAGPYGVGIYIRSMLTREQEDALAWGAFRNGPKPQWHVRERRE